MKTRMKVKALMALRNLRNLTILGILMILGAIANLQAQVTIGADIAPNSATLLDLKMQQLTGTISNVTDNVNVTSTTGGLLLPRVKLVSPTTMEPFIATTASEWVSNTNSIKQRLAGLMVYNLSNTNGLLIGINVWDGSKWNSTQTPFYISTQPKAFTWYENFVLKLETIAPLTVAVSGGVAPITYQWYQVTSSNLHVRISSPVILGSGGTTATYTPTQVKISDGDTRNAAETGFYRFYCIATDATGQKAETNIAEIAVGCGAKDLNGEWLSFMCFNLGATRQTIAAQQTTSIPFLAANASDGSHIKAANEELTYGDLFQWGRIADGHEKRSKIQVGSTGGGASDNQAAWNTVAPPTYEDGNILGTTQQYPWRQVARSNATYYGKFIMTILDNEHNWYAGSTSYSDRLWRENIFPPNDPCQKVTAAGMVPSGNTPEWYPAASSSTAGGSSGTGWRLPSQFEWASLYRGGTVNGSHTIALANTWEWYQPPSSSSTEGAKGSAIKPDGITTTLFLPAAGDRAGHNSMLFFQGSNARYWSTSISGVYAYYLNANISTVNPAYTNARGSGYALRCIKY